MRIEKTARRTQITEALSVYWAEKDAPPIPQEIPFGYNQSRLVEVRPSLLTVTYSWDEETSSWQYNFRISGHRINRDGKTSIVSMQIDKARIPVVDAGGIGARLWPTWLLELVAEHSPADVLTITSRVLEQDPHVAAGALPESLDVVVEPRLTEHCAEAGCTHYRWVRGRAVTRGDLDDYLRDEGWHPIAAATETAGLSVLGWLCPTHAAIAAATQKGSTL